MKILKLYIPGEPVSGSQLKFNRTTGSAYRPKEHKQRVFTIHEYAEKYRIDNDLEKPVFGNGIPLLLTVHFEFPYLKGHYRSGKHSDELKPNAPLWKIGNKDLDNLLKPLKDGLKGVLIADDKQIVRYGCIEKAYSKSPSTEIVLSRLD
jgi:Holliday junction resolvase RusA-like endonuclease